jgi:hypothetical protein
LKRDNQGSYPLPFTGVELELHGFSPDKIWLDGRALAVTQTRFSIGTFNQIDFED